MVEKEQAPIERDISLLKNTYFELSRVKRMAREWRYDLGEHARVTLLQMSLCFDIGWKTTDKAYKKRCFETASGYLFNFQHSLNQLNDVQVIDNDQKAVLDLLTDKIDEQLASLSSSIVISQRDGVSGNFPPAVDSLLKGHLTAL